MSQQAPSSVSARRVHRFEVRAKPGRIDPKATAVLRQAKAAAIGLNSVATARIYLVEGEFNSGQISAIQSRLLADPVCEGCVEGVQNANFGSQVIEVHPLPGVMDPAAQSVRDAIGDLFGASVLGQTNVSTGMRFDLAGLSADQAQGFAKQSLANEVIHRIHAGPFHPASLPKGTGYEFTLRHIPLRGLTDSQLERLSRDAHLFLSLDEMRAVQSEFDVLGRDPTDIELETLAQTWSEHCVHKTLKATVRYRGPKTDTISWTNRPGHVIESDGSVTINNLLKSTVAAATFELMADGVDWALSVFKDNSGVIAFDDNYGVCIKVETHNHPSAIEPYGGAATGAGGCIRDVIGTGLGAHPIANTDVFCVAHPTKDPAKRPPGTIDPRRTLTEVVAGVRDYGNRMGIPTLNGAVQFDDRYVGNPLVFCGCIGLIPRDKIKGEAKRGDLIVALGGRTGRDGIHGATFSSTELEHTSADEFSHAVQIGNAIEEKRVLDAIMRARDHKDGTLYNGMTDCGAGGFSSAVGEMGSKIGAEVHLDKAPLKYAGLSYTEIWISEAQERMVLAVPQAKLATLQAICDEEHVELAVLGTFGTPKDELVLNYKGTEVGRMPMHFLHDGIPMPTREAVWTPTVPLALAAAPTMSIQETLLKVLAHPTVASKHWIIRQYDHEVQGNTVLKPLVGPAHAGPGDASIIEPVPGSGRGVALACGMNIAAGDPAIGGDPYQMALCGIDEAVRNLVCVGTDPDRIAILDNFCWPSCKKSENMGSLVRASEGCYDGAKAYRTPFVSGKDSLNNQLSYVDADGVQRVIEIPPTLLITGMGIVQNLSRVVTMDAKKAGNVLLLVGPKRTGAPMGGSIAHQVGAHYGEQGTPTVDLKAGPKIARAVAELIGCGLVVSAHDCSDGGMLTALAEMLIASFDSERGSALGFEFAFPAGDLETMGAIAFSEGPSRYVLEVKAQNAESVLRMLGGLGLNPAETANVLGALNSSGRLTWRGQGVSNVDVAVADLTSAWRGTLDW